MLWAVELRNALKQHVQGTKNQFTGNFYQIGIQDHFEKIQSSTIYEKHESKLGIRIKPLRNQDEKISKSKKEHSLR